MKVVKEILARDGYRCRFCGSRVIVKEAQKALIKALPTAARWGRRNDKKHFGLSVLIASIDHLLPYNRGGDNGPYNLVTACSPCQFGRGHWLLEEVELEDPRKYSPLVDCWDGLYRLRGFELESEPTSGKVDGASDS